MQLSYLAQINCLLVMHFETRTRYVDKMNCCFRDLMTNTTAFFHLSLYFGGRCYSIHTVSLAFTDFMYFKVASMRIIISYAFRFSRCLQHLRSFHDETFGFLVNQGWRNMC